MSKHKHVYVHPMYIYIVDGAWMYAWEKKKGGTQIPTFERVSDKKKYLMSRERDEGEKVVSKVPISR